MDSSSKNGTSSAIDAIRNTVISRRGGVRVRGGRLPPIRMRDVMTLTSSKKTIAPNIPQRRVRVKEETADKNQAAVRPKEEWQRPEKASFRGRGGRGARVYIQTDGAFLGEGPAMKAKIESSEQQYDRGSRSSGRGSSSRVKNAADVKIEESTIRELLEHYDGKEDFWYTDNNIKPVRLPLVKMERKFEIKQEIIDNDEAKPRIKEEPIESSDEKWGALEGKFFTRIKKEIDAEVKVNHPFQGEGRFILFQLPSCMPMGGSSFEDVKQKIKKEKIETNEVTVEKGNLKAKDKISGSELKDMSEGFIGKLQVLKSGNMRLVLGSVVMSLEKATDSETSFEVVSIPIREKEETGHLIVLGSIGQKVIMYPELDPMMV